jgi:hypothetical protein
MMSEAVQYYTGQFGQDLVAVRDAGGGIADRISLLTFLPGQSGPSRGQAHAFRGLAAKERVLFLMCYFYSALLDQAVHASLRDEHFEFDRLAQYPKLVGILGSYHHNIHPAHLLMAATMHLEGLSEESATGLFQELTDHMADEYVRFFTAEYPAMSGRMVSATQQRRALRLVLGEMAAATSRPESQLWGFLLDRLSPSSRSLASKWIHACATKMRATLDTVAD